MKKMICMVLLALSSVSAFAGETCYQVSSTAGAWSRTPELLCVAQTDAQENKYDITLRSGMPFQQETVATFSLNLVSAVRCMDCNKNVYALSNPSNSTFNALAIRFDGQRDIRAQTEEGTVTIGSTLFHYRK